MDCALNMTGIVKSYSGVPVLKNVSLEIHSGEIHALLGENGAGKTTLMNILGGVVPMDEGEIKIYGKKTKISNPADSQSIGIAFIHQELNVVNDLAVYENLFLGYELTNKVGKLDVAEMCKQSADVFSRMNVDIDPRTMMRDLDASYKQIVEISKSVLRNARIIIMDEPTTSLTQTEVENVFAIMRGLTKEHGVTIIFISHKLGEVVDFCDSYTVLRNGEKVSDGKINDPSGRKIDQTEIARMMVGREVLGVKVYEDHDIGEVILEAKKLYVNNSVRDMNFQLHKGEILGVTGLLGDGKEELIRAIFGDLKITEGKLLLKGKEIRYNHPSGAKRNGIGLLPSNRKENAIIKDLSVQKNLSIVALEKFSFGPAINFRKERLTAEHFRDRLKIKVEKMSNMITHLSGGNQQKVVLAKWLVAEPEIMILSNPTQGVDVGAKNEIYSVIMELAKQGMSFIVTSGEAQEIMKICDRVLVMYHGEVRGELKRKELTEEAIMILSTGGYLS